MTHLYRAFTKRLIAKSLHYQPLDVSHLVKLAFGDAVAVVDDPGGLETGRLVELDEQLSHHGGQVLYDILPVLLDPNRGTVPAGMGVHAAYHLEGGRRREGGRGDSFRVQTLVRP